MHSAAAAAAARARALSVGAAPVGQSTPYIEMGSVPMGTAVPGQFSDVRERHSARATALCSARPHDSEREGPCPRVRSICSSASTT